MSEPDRLRETLTEAGVIHIDASVLALHLTGDRRYLPLTRGILTGMADGAFEGRTSSMSLYQLLVEPFRRGRDGQAEMILACLSAFPGLEIVPVTASLAGQAAQVRAQIGGTVERAVQIATALEMDAEVFVTQRSTLRRIAGMSVEQLESYISPEGTAPPV